MKTVLLAVCGLTPQVVTETLYALHQQGAKVDAIRILTTRGGKDACISRLFGAEDGMYFRYLADYGLSSDHIDFSPRHVLAVADSLGIEIDDISTEHDNELFLGACMEEAFRWTSDPATRVFFSIAGGRKTMGSCLSLAAQCYGRPQDRIFHVLVSPEFESSPEFFYPPPVSRPITLYDRSRAPYIKETRYAQVTLVPMPFFSLRERLSERLMKEPESPATLMLSLVREPRPELTIDLAQRKVIWKGVELDVMPAPLALLAFFALRKKETTCGGQRCNGCGECFFSFPELLDHQEEISALYRRAATRIREEQARKPHERGITTLDDRNFLTYKSRLNKQIEDRFGRCDARLLCLDTRGRRPGLRYGIRLDRQRLRIVL